MLDYERMIDDALQVIEELLYVLPRLRTEYEITNYAGGGNQAVFDMIDNWIRTLKKIKDGFSDPLISDKDKIEDALQLIETYISRLQQEIARGKTEFFPPQVFQIGSQWLNSMEKIKARLTGTVF